MQYRNYHVNILVGPRGSAESITRSIFVADIGPGTKRAAREIIRSRYGARKVALGKGTICEAPRKGCESVSATALRKERSRQNGAIRRANVATAA